MLLFQAILLMAGLTTKTVVADTAARKCKGWCSKKADVWTEKCTWVSCNGCSECGELVVVLLWDRMWPNYANKLCHTHHLPSSALFHSQQPMLQYPMLQYLRQPPLLSPRLRGENGNRRDPLPCATREPERYTLRPRLENCRTS